MTKQSPNYHVYKTEDIINRAGGVLALYLWNTDEAGNQLETDVTVYMDGIAKTFKAGEEILVYKGDSITLPPHVAHVFGPKAGYGELVVGEVSKVNDDNTDNYFLDHLPRFTEFEGDEPTSALTSKEIEELFRIVRQLKSEGKGIVYISHRLEELQHIVDRVTIIRDGQYILENDFAAMEMSDIIANMVGREIKEKFPRVHCEKGKKTLEVRHLNAGRMVRDVSFESYEGEILGLAGLMGAGRTETTRAIFGVDPRESGQIFIDGMEIKISGPLDAIKNGLVLAPEDRKKDGLCTKLSVRSNIELPNLDIVSNKLSVVNRGIDVAAKVEIYHIMNQLKQQGIKTAIEYLTNGTEEFENVDTGVTMLTADYIVENGLL